MLSNTHNFRELVTHPFFRSNLYTSLKDMRLSLCEVSFRILPQHIPNITQGGNVEPGTEPCSTQ